MERLWYDLEKELAVSFTDQCLVRLNKASLYSGKGNS